MTWRPLPGPGEERAPRPVRESLEGFAQRLGVPQAGALGAVFQRWDELVGPAVASHVKPLSLVQGALKVAVEDSSWATHFKFLAPGLLERLAAELGEGVVTRVDVRVDRPESARGGRRRPT